MRIASSLGLLALLACAACSSSTPSPATDAAASDSSGDAAPDTSPDTSLDTDTPDAPTKDSATSDATDATSTDAGSFEGYVPATGKIGDKDYTAWSIEWWKWLIAIPQATTPTEGGDCKQGQSGDVWFLAGGSGTTKATRSCTIPSGRTLFFPLANSICFPCHEDEGCSTPKTEAELTDCTKLGDATSLSVTVDGKSVAADLNGFHFTSKQFSFKGPATGGIFGACTGPIPTNTCSIPVGDRYGVSDGYWLALEPLAAGTHVLTFKSVIPMSGGSPLTQDVTYNLTVE